MVGVEMRENKAGFYHSFANDRNTDDFCEVEIACKCYQELSIFQSFSICHKYFNSFASAIFIIAINNLT
jgi:hypothetical protein